MAELTTLARPYAKAAFEFALNEKALDAWSDFLTVHAAIVSHPKVESQLDSPVLTAEQKIQLVRELADTSEKSAQSNFIALLAENKRLALLPNIAELFELFKASYEKSVDVDIESAFAMSDAQLEKLASSLEHHLKRKVELNASVDESLIGGVKVKAGDTVIDASVRGRLDRLGEALGA